MKDYSFGDAIIAIFGAFCVFVIIAWIAGFFSIKQIIHHEQACLAVANFKKDTGTAGVHALLNGDANEILKNEWLRAGPWLAEDIFVEVSQTGKIQTQIGPWKVPCSFTLKYY